MTVTVPIKGCCDVLLGDVCDCAGIPPRITEWPGTPSAQSLRATWDEYLAGPTTCLPISKGQTP